MFQFTGYLLSKHFELTEAESPKDLYQLLKSKDDPPLKELRCWVLFQNPENDDFSIWLEVVFIVPDYFDSIKHHFGNKITIRFQTKGQPSPNSTTIAHSSLKEEESSTYRSLTQQVETLLKLGK